MGRLYRFFRHLVVTGPETAVEKAIFPVLVLSSWVYGSLGLLRSFLYRIHLIPSYRAAVPVISVGNLSAGGTGKTPIVDYLARYLISIGRKVAVVSRGYGRKNPHQLIIVARGDGPLVSPAFAGDEPFLLACRNPALVVIVASKRKEGVAVAVNDCGAEVIILDDGFQHLAVRRDLDMVLLDSGRPLGNGRILPVGPLREFPSALKRGDLFILTRAKNNIRSGLTLPGQQLACRHKLSSVARTLHGDSVNISSLIKLRGAAFAGIAAPEQFFAELKSAGLNIVKTVAFQDHTIYGRMERMELNGFAPDVDYLITTEKDGVKLGPDDFEISCYVVPMTIDFFGDDKLKTIIDRLLNL